jgi:hypothetical protein
MSSLQLLAECQLQGLLTKEAATEILELREAVVKRARMEKAAGLISSMRGAGSKVKGGLGEFWGGFKRSFGHGRPTTGGGRPVIEGKVTQPGTHWSDVAGNMAKYIMLGGLAVGGAAGAKALIQKPGQRRERKEIEKSYKQMFQDHPKLGEFDRHKVQRHFGVLARYAPSMAADPVVAGTWVKDKMEMGHIAAADIKLLAETQSQINKVKESKALFAPGAFRTGTDLAGKAMITSKAVGG